MKEFLKQFSLIFFFLLLSSNSFSAPLNGAYTIGSAGTYPTINSAFFDAFTQGVSGPVIFSVIPGVYNEEVMIYFIPGSDSVNTVKLTSQSGNSEDVLINGNQCVFDIESENIIIDKLTFGSSALRCIDLHGRNITFSNNNFAGTALLEFAGGGANLFGINITGNKNIDYIKFEGGDFGQLNSHIQITGNSINRYIGMVWCAKVLIEKNNIGEGISTIYFTGDIIKNKIEGYLSTGGHIYNNFILGTVFDFTDLINNTIVGGTLNSPTVSSHYSNSLKNNIIINPSGGTALSITNVLTFSDYNDLYNGGNINLIYFDGSNYNNVSDFYSSTGLDEHSNSRPVNFLSSADLHLSGPSVGDEELTGIPVSFIADDIDDQLRSPAYPYKGADEVPNSPLPVELTSFTSSVNNNQVLLSWTTSSEVNNSGFDVERSALNGDWIMLNFVRGHGNSNVPQNYTYEDIDLVSGKYKFRLKQIDFNGNFKYYYLSDKIIIGVPEKFMLYQNYPNPFNPTTVIRYLIPSNVKGQTSNVKLVVYNNLGKEVVTLVNEKQNPGSYEVKFRGENLPNGVYFYKLQTANFSEVKRMILLK